jgi:taurine dioxygenase
MSREDSSCSGSVGFGLKKLSVGAEVTELDFADLVNRNVRQALYTAWLEHGMLLFRGVDSNALHLELSRCFGTIEPHPVVEARNKAEPLLNDVGGDKNYAFVYDEVDVIANRIPWHRDNAFTPDVCKGAMLRMLTVPATAGETWFADTAAAYDDLDDTFKQQISRLEYKATLNTGDLSGGHPGTWWKTARRPTAAEFHVDKQISYASVVQKYPSVILPAVLVHPESHRKCLYLSPTYVDAFLGMSQAESDQLLRRLTDHMLQTRYTYRHKWSVDDALVWDNRRLMHAAQGHRPGERRRGLRTTIAESYRVGRFFDSSVKAAAHAIAD